MIFLGHILEAQIVQPFKSATHLIVTKMNVKIIYKKDKYRSMQWL